MSNSYAGGHDWLYEPGTVGDADHYLALRYTPGAIAERASAFDSGVYDVYVEDWVEANRDGTFENFGEVDVSTSGRTALVTGTEPTREYDFYLRDF